MVAAPFLEIQRKMLPRHLRLKGAKTKALIFTSLCILAALGLCWAMRAFSSCGTLAVYLQHAGLVASWHVGS